jgi:hypothetical protein
MLWLFVFQKVAEIRKTCNQLSDKLSVSGCTSHADH